MHMWYARKSVGFINQFGTAVVELWRARISDLLARDSDHMYPWHKGLSARTWALLHLCE